MLEALLLSLNGFVAQQATKSRYFVKYISTVHITNGFIKKISVEYKT